MKTELITVFKDQTDRLQQKLKILEGLAQGEKAIIEGRIVLHDDAEKRMERWLKC
ncbi:MAG TPA: hypothetical protein VF181_12585 [Balneolaceae bacterium]